MISKINKTFLNIKCNLWNLRNKRNLKEITTAHKKQIVINRKKEENLNFNKENLIEAQEREKVKTLKVVKNWERKE